MSPQAQSGDSLLLGVDAGGTVTKAALFTVDGRQVALATERAAPATPHPRWLERDMEDAWQTAARAVRRVIEDNDVAPARIAAAGIAAHNEGAYLVDSALEPIRPAILAGDSRAHDELDRWARNGTVARVLELTGQEPGTGSPAPLLAWLAAHEPEALARTRWLLCCKDWLRLRLTGEVATDPSDAASLFTEVRTGEYSDRVLACFGMPSLGRILPPIRGSAAVVGRVTRRAADETGLPAGLPVVTGAHDVDAGAIGVGAIRPGRLSMMAGTWSINQIPADEVRLDPRWEARAFVEAERWLHMATSPASAATLEWFVDRFGPVGDDRFAVVDREVAEVGDDPAGPAFHPFLLGSPYGAEASGAFLGLRGWHGRGHVLRAVFEGVVCTHREHVAALREAFSIEDAGRLTGGGARSDIWCQMFADALRLPVEVPDTEEAGARGAAVLAGVGVGVWPDLAQAAAATVRVRRRYEPERTGASRFDEIFARYATTVAALRPVWRQLA